MKQTFGLVHDTARQRAASACLTSPDGYVCTIKPATRNLEQNAASWPILAAFSQQLQWPVNGQMVTLTPEEFKDVLTAAFRKETQPRLAAGFDGGIVMLGHRTSKFTVKEFSEWIEWLHMAAAVKGVTV